MRKIAVATSKGGVGKTTVSVNLGASLAMAGKKVLIIDTDPQGNAGAYFGYDHDVTLAEALRDGREDCILEVRENLDVILSGRQKLNEYQDALVGKIRREERFAVALKFLDKWGYDFIFCDFSPTVTLINTAALFFCDSILMPMVPGIDALAGAARYLELAKELKGETPPARGVFNLYERTIISEKVDETARGNFKMLETRIRKNVAVPEARLLNKTIFEYDNKSHAAQDFINLRREFLTWQTNGENSQQTE